MNWKSLLSGFHNFPLPNLDQSIPPTNNEEKVRYVSYKFLVWENSDESLTKIDMSRCSAISSFDGNLYVVIDGQRYYPPLTFEQADHYWYSARHQFDA
jgi:hypothetical protein